VRGDRGRITVEVQEAPAGIDRCVEVAAVVQVEGGLDVIGARHHVHHPGRMGQRQAAPVAARDRLLHASDRAHGEERHQPPAVKRHANGETSHH
jgi:hypothetical protein